MDTSRSLSHVVAETDGTGAPTAYYVRSDDELIQILRPDGAGGYVRKAVHADGIGSIRKLTDSAGNVTDSYEYTAFGELISHVGSDPQPYAFAGEPYDPNSGLQYHRARWMDSRSARFTSADPFDGFVLDPLTLHRYLYANLDPVNRSDPSGYFSSLLYGNRVHEAIGIDFSGSGPGRDWDLAISRIVGVRGVPFVGRMRPDLIDFVNKEIYEIKTIRGIPQGHSELTGYLLMLNWADPDTTRPWRRGTAAHYRPPSTIPLGLGAFAIVGPPVGGVIAYDVLDLKLVVAAVATVAVMSMKAQGAHLEGRFAVATLVVAFGGF